VRQRLGARQQVRAVVGVAAANHLDDHAAHADFARVAKRAIDLSG
jgi:hypothetical protein